MNNSGSPTKGFKERILFSPPNEKVYMPCPMGLNHYHFINIHAPDDYTGGSMELIWKWKADKPGTVVWNVGAIVSDTMNVDPTTGEPLLTELNGAYLATGGDEIPLDTDGGIQETLLVLPPMPSGKVWSFGLCRAGEHLSDNAGDVRVKEVVLRYLASEAVSAP